MFKLANLKNVTMCKFLSRRKNILNFNPDTSTHLADSFVEFKQPLYLALCLVSRVH